MSIGGPRPTGRSDAEVIVVGGGHNGLITAAYLARAGIDTLLVEARAAVGGCAATVSDLGARFNVCHCDHTLIRATPIADELELARHGLHYLEPPTGNVHLFHDGSPPWVQFHEPEAMLEGLARTHPAQVDGYRRYLDDALPVAELVLAMLTTPPTTARMARTVADRRAVGAARLLDWSRRSATAVLRRYFDDWRFITPAASLGPTVWGVSPDRVGTGMAALAYATRHLVRSGRPVGGSGALTDAVRSCLVAAGGRVRAGARVDELTVADGGVTGVRLDDGTELRSSVVVAATDPRTVLVQWLTAPPPAARRLVERWRATPVPEGYESKLDAVLTRPPRFAALGELEREFPGVDFLAATTVVNPHPTDLAIAHSRRERGQVAPRPTLLVNAPTVLDPTMAPGPGRHVLSLEVLFTPYHHPGGWPDSPEPARWLEVWGALAEPGFADSVDRWRVMTPDRYEREFLLGRGHPPAYAAHPLATLIGRRPELSRYRTPITGLYLSGAGTYPGAGVSGAPGRNAAAAVLADLQTPRRRTARARRLCSRAGGGVPLRPGDRSPAP
ncbi:MAG: phytoene desaturase family protein [Acidimicrobiales bacterium]